MRRSFMNARLHVLKIPSSNKLLDPNLSFRRPFTQGTSRACSSGESSSRLLKIPRGNKFLEPNVSFRWPIAQRRACSSGEPNVLQESWPRLIALFEELSDGDVFPLMTKKQNDRYKQRVKAEVLKHDRKAAVLLLMATIDDRPSIIFTKRAAHLSQHAAQISFPGGHFETSLDMTLLDTAIRETNEELLPSDETFSLVDNIEILGKTSCLPSINGLPVTTYLSVLWKKMSTTEMNSLFPGDPDEVDQVFSVSIEELVSGETSHKLPENRFGMIMGPKFVSKHGDIWGLTALILRPVLRNLLVPTFLKPCR